MEIIGYLHGGLYNKNRRLVVQSWRRSTVYFSVIIPAYNAERFIGATMRSLLAQTFADFEAIVVNDGSDDNTLAVLEKFKADKRIAVYTIPRQGTYAAADNFALRRARGEYIAFLDSDDVWAQRKLERCRAHIEATGARFVFSNGYLIDPQGRRIGRLLSPRMRRRLQANDPLLLLTNVIATSSVVVRRDILPAGPFEVRADTRASEDYRLWLQLNRDHEIHYVPQPLIRYRVHPQQMSGVYDTMLKRWERILELERCWLSEVHSQGMIGLADELVTIKKVFARRQRWKAVARCAGLAWSSRGPERRILMEYLRFGLVQRVTNLVLRKLRRGLSFR